MLVKEKETRCENVDLFYLRISGAEYAQKTCFILSAKIEYETKASLAIHSTYKDG